ncbi:hypothetical protein [Jiella pelagia]|uniref:Uncharacterized protein n=1 Tax=Jiella pelagia TaxID=2986949 RepID=A0ABY7BW07_9HYPH|nr:hypothetical protein [Jiella pelagia]WAP67689.1 hypothetical protein OH818_19730 [Jiella pelagia]
MVNGKPMSWSRIAQRMMSDEIGGALYDYEQYGLIEGEALRRFAAQISMLTEPKLDWCVRWLKMQNQIKDKDFDSLFSRIDIPQEASRIPDESYIAKWRGYWRVIHSDDGRRIQKRRTILFEFDSQEDGLFTVNATEFVEPIGNRGVESGQGSGDQRQMVIGTGVLHAIGSMYHLIQILDQKSMRL